MSSAITQTQKELLTSFGVFVGLYNKLNGTTFTVLGALKNQDVVDLFSTTAQTIKTKSVSINMKKSTKQQSLAKFKAENGTSVAHSIYKFVKQQNKPVSRSEIARGLNIRLSTVCGQVLPLIECNLLKVTGSKLDKTSNRQVEIVTAN